MPRIPDDATIEDVDLDQEEIYLPDGRRLTEQVAEEEAAAGMEFARRRGRPSLSGGRTHSPQIGVRLSEDLNERLQARAKRDHKKASEIVREALEEYV